jgi:ClpX C4-type zinc finger
VRREPPTARCGPSSGRYHSPVPHETVHCSFCKKSSEDVRKVVAGPDDVYICDECIGLAADLVREDPGNVPVGSGPDAS